MFLKTGACWNPLLQLNINTIAIDLKLIAFLYPVPDHTDLSLSNMIYYLSKPLYKFFNVPNHNYAARDSGQLLNAYM